MSGSYGWEVIVRERSVLPMLGPSSVAGAPLCFRYIHITRGTALRRCGPPHRGMTQAYGCPSCGTFWPEGVRLLSVTGGPRRQEGAGGQDDNVGGDRWGQLTCRCDVPPGSAGFTIQH